MYDKVWSIRFVTVCPGNCRQAQDKISDITAQAQVKAQELTRDVSCLFKITILQIELCPDMELFVCN